MRTPESNHKVNICLVGQRSKLVPVFYPGIKR